MFRMRIFGGRCLYLFKPARICDGYPSFSSPVLQLPVASISRSLRSGISNRRLRRRFRDMFSRSSFHRSLGQLSHDVHINAKEFIASWFFLVSVATTLNHQSILWRVVISTALSFIGRKSAFEFEMFWSGQGRSSPWHTASN
jgi:hypothetical protein